VASKPGKILIVEDSPTMCQLYRIVLGRGDTELVFAHSGVDGLDRAAQETDVDLYIVDINMPQMDGLEFLRRLRGELGVLDTPAVVISTEGEESDLIAAREAGANAYLRKPWTPDQLLQTVTTVFEGSEE
jgi:two-component system, chemotaxis family, chemotaxis protein CheY